MKLLFSTAILVVLVPLAKAIEYSSHATLNWLNIADDTCKKECSQPNATFNPRDDVLELETCTVTCSCSKKVFLPDDTSCIILVEPDGGAGGLGDFSEFTGKCAQGACQKTA